MTRKPKRLPLHAQIANQLRREIARTRKPGDRLESELALAKRFDTSVLTVREALSALAEQGVLVRRHGSGTYVQDPRARQHVAIVIDLDISHPRTSYCHLRVIQQVRKMVQAAGFQVRLYLGHAEPGSPWTGSPQCPDFFQHLEAGDICGVVAVATDSGVWEDRVTEAGVPITGNGGGYVYRVTADLEAMIRQGVERLVALGRHRIAYLGWASPEPFIQAMRQHHLPVHKAWIRGDLHPSTEGAGWEEFREIWLGREEKPDGLLISDDLLLADAAAAILDLRITVPDTLAIVAAMNRGSLIMPPFPVDRLELDPDAIAAALVEQILQALRNEPIEPPTTVIFFQWRLATDQPARPAATPPVSTT